MIGASRRRGTVARGDSRPIRAVARIGAMLLLALAGLPSVSGAAAQDAGWIATDRTDRVERSALDAVRVVTARALNVRPQPSTQLPPVALLEQGDIVSLTGAEIPASAEDPGWIAVRTPGGVEGWVSGRYVAPLDATIERVEAAMALLAGAGPAIAAIANREDPVDKVRVGFIYQSAIGDAGWTFSHDAGRKALEALPFVEWTRYVESVPEEPQAVAAAIDGLVAEGANLIFTTSFGYMDPTIAAAARHPDVVFMHSAGFKTAANAGTYFGRIYEARYLAGIIAGGMTRSNIIGYAAAFPIAQVIRGINAFALGVQSVNPEAKVRVTWTKAWYSPGVEREVAEELLDGGADVVTMHQNSPAVVQAAGQRGRYAIGYHSDMSLFAPETTLASVSWDWTPLYTKIATDVHEGTWEPYKLWWGSEAGVVRLAGVKADLLPEPVRQRLAAAEAGLRDGSLRIFEGTLRDQSGSVRVPSGRVMTDEELLAMDFFVMGIEGELPAPKPAAGPTN